MMWSRYDGGDLYADVGLGIVLRLSRKPVPRRTSSDDKVARPWSLGVLWVALVIVIVAPTTWRSLVRGRRGRMYAFWSRGRGAL